MNFPASATDGNARMVNIRWFVLLLVTVIQASCGPSGDTGPPVVSSRGLEFRIVLDEESCGPPSEAVEFESFQMGKMVLCVHSRADLVLTGQDLVSIAPRKLSGVSADRPEMIVWTAILKLRPEAAARIRSLGSELAPEEQILISADREPLDVTYARVVGQMMSVGEFSSRDELVRALGKYAVVEEEVDEEIEVFSPEELAAKRRRAELLERSDRVLHETQKIRRLAAEGSITHEEMMERLDELRREDTGQ